MKRELGVLADAVFDVIVVGGGITGACAARDAATRGLSVALVEQGDFGGATSANSLKVLHGGLRYLQTLDIRRMRESIGERRAMAASAPHLVRPMPFVIPTHGQRQHGKSAMRIALALNDAIGFDRNRGLPPSLHLPNGRILARNEYLGLVSELAGDRCTGGALWYDYQAVNTERITLGFLAAAAAHGAVLANYVRVDGLLTQGDTIRGVRVHDTVGGDRFDIRAHLVINAAGPWMDDIASTDRREEPARLALAINLVSRRPSVSMGVGLQSPWGRDRDPVCGGGRFMFMVPWKQSTLLGTSYQVYRGPTDGHPVREEHLQAVVDEFNDASPRLALSLSEISWYHWGWVPLKAVTETGRTDALAERSRVIDHEAVEGRRGLISLRSVKYTTARRLAERGIDLVEAKLSRSGGGKPNRRTGTVNEEMERTDSAPLDTPSHAPELPPEARERVAATYGGYWPSVAATGGADPMTRQPLSAETAVLGCELLYAVEREMAVTLADVVFRRTDLGTERCPHAKTLSAAAQVMGDRLGWTADRRAAEIDAVFAAYRPLPSPPAAVDDGDRLAQRRETA